MEIRTELINEEGIISEKYTCDGEDVNPSIALGEIPEFTKSIALIFEDPDAPDPNPFVHWLLWNVSPGDKIKEDSFPEGAVRGENDFGKLNYGGPCPPIGTHKYFLRIYALDSMLDLEEGAEKEDLIREMEGHIIEEKEISGEYSKKE